MLWVNGVTKLQAQEAALQPSKGSSSPQKTKDGRRLCIIVEPDGREF